MSKIPFTIFETYPDMKVNVLNLDSLKYRTKIDENSSYTFL